MCIPMMVRVNCHNNIAQERNSSTVLYLATGLSLAGVVKYNYDLLERG